MTTDTTLPHVREPHSYFSALLDADTESICKDIDITPEHIAEIAADAEIKFRKKVAALKTSMDKYEELYLRVQEKVLRIETHLTQLGVFGDLRNITDLETALSFLHTACTKTEDTGLFLSEAYMIEILTQTPPVRILAYLGVNDIADALKKLDPLAILSLTRHTEADTWQDQYFSYLIHAPRTAFEERPVSYRVFDWNTFGPLLSASGRSLKPWHISHNKETGCIHAFTLDAHNTQPAPHIQCAAVYMHYYYETLYAGISALKKNSTGSKQLGEHFRDIIKSGAQKYPFFPPNTYSEHLFWEQAMKLFHSTFYECSETHFFANTLSCGGHFDNSMKGPRLSLNLIDHIWDQNIPKKSAGRAYFTEGKRASAQMIEPSTFLYHFQGGMWYDVLKSALHFPDTAYAEFIIEHLNLGDVPLTQALATSAHTK